MRILVTDGMDAGAIQALREMGHEVVEQFYAPEALGAALREFDACVVRSKTKVRANHIDEALGGRLKLIIRGGVGVDNIDVAYAEQNGIAVRNTKEGLRQGHRAAGQDPWHHRLRPHRPEALRPGKGHRHGRGGL